MDFAMVGRHFTHAVSLTCAVEREGLEHECQKAEQALAARQSELRAAQARLQDEEAEAARRGEPDPAALQRAVSAMTRKVEAQIADASIALVQRREDLKQLMQGKRCQLAAAVGGNAREYYRSNHAQLRALRREQTRAATDDGDTRAARRRAEDTDRSIAQLATQLHQLRRAVADARAERDSLLRQSR